MPGDILLRTRAIVQPAFRVENLAAPDLTVPLNAERPGYANFVTRSYGKPGEPPADLGRLRLAPEGVAQWLGAKEAEPSRDGLLVEARRFRVRLDSGATPGTKSLEILIGDGANVAHREVVNWEVRPVLLSSPNVIVLKGEVRVYRLMLTSHDQKPFRVEKVDVGLPGASASCDGADARATHILTLNLDTWPVSIAGRGSLTVVTDHPGQKKAEVPIVRLGETTASAGR
jgi:hypothetical protein